MRSASRTAFLLTAVAAALSCAGCARLSNNKGKIEGKWKLVSSSSATESDNALLQAGQVGVYMEFAGDGKATLMIEVPGLGVETSSGRYNLLAEDFVEFRDFPNQKRKSGGFLGPVNGRDHVRATISGDDMTLMTMDETLKFTRVK